jgi:hypothetical protein
VSDQPGQPGSRQLAVATLAAAIVQVRGKADPEAVAEALRDAAAALRAANQQRRAGRQGERTGE